MFVLKSRQSGKRFYQGQFIKKIKKIKWWQRPFLFFARSVLVADVRKKDITIFMRHKKMFGRTFIVDMWEEKAEVNGIPLLDFPVVDLDCEVVNAVNDNFWDLL